MEKDTLTLNWNNKLESIFRKDNSFELARMVLMIYARGFFFLFGKLIVTEDWKVGRARFFQKAAFTLLQF